MSVADFFARYADALHSLGIEPAIYASPVEVVTAIPFAQDFEHATYNADAAHQCWSIFLNAQRVMKRFRGAFTGNHFNSQMAKTSSLPPRLTVARRRNHAANPFNAIALPEWVPTATSV